MFCVTGVPGLVVGTELRLELLFGWKEEIKKMEMEIEFHLYLHCIQLSIVEI